MGILDFFKKILEEDKVVENGKEKIAFSDIRNWIEKKGKENEIREKEILVSIDNKINLFVKELEEKIKIVKNVDVESKKSEDKLKSLANEGRKKYLESIEIFIENLDKLKKDNLEEFFGNVNTTLLNFNKNSCMSYERATILIGKEMESIRGGIKTFSKNLANIFKENKKIIESSKIISDVELKLNKILEMEKEFKEIGEVIILINKKTEERKEENKRLTEKIEEIKKDPEYLENLEREKKIKFLEEELEKDILSLKQIIDFKALSNFLHIFEEEIKIVKSHREDFSVEFKKDEGKSILSLLNEAKLNNETISEKVKQIKSKKEEIEKNKQDIQKDETQELYSSITKILLEIGNLKNEKEKEEKRIEKLRFSRNEVIEEVEEKVEEIGAEVER